MNRRDVIRKVALGGAIVIVIPSILSSCAKDDPGPGGGNLLEIDLTEASNLALANTNGFVIVSGIIVVNTGSGNFIALSAICTHEGCTISYSSTGNTFPCPCHGSLFAINGSVLNGPASRPLKVYKVTKTDNILKIE